MSADILKLSPSLVWKYFYRICKIPHGSGNEAAIADAVRQWAADAGCATETDDAGNIIVDIAPTPGREHAPGIVIQAHLDMVCEKNSDKEFNFKTDSLQLLIEEGWVTADGTSLGADNGIGLAMGLALMEDKAVSHGPLELLCTMDEETGLNGAMELKRDWLKGQILVNTDTEEEGVFIIGCAGGCDTDLTLELEREPTGDALQLEIQVRGLTGGHSGMEIHLNRGNAVRLMCLALRGVQQEVSLRISQFGGGDKHNAIPREATAVVCIDPADEAKCRQLVAQQADLLRTGLPQDEQAFSIAVVPHESTIPPLDVPSTDKLLQLLLGIPHGVVAMSRELEGITESSTNLANAKLAHNILSVLTSSRSSKQVAIDAIAAQITAVGELAGAEVNVHTGYPPWEPDFDSPILPPAAKLWEEMHGVAPLITTIHAGLEGGIIKDRYPNLDIISFGPDIEMPHSPFERVRIESVEKTYAFMGKLLVTLAQ